MRKSRLSEEKIIAILKEAESSAKVTELVRRHGISANTFYRWRWKYGDLDQLRRELRSRPAAADERSADGSSALDLAAFFGQDRAVRVLLARGADVEATDGRGGTLRPLHGAAASQRAGMVRLLLAAGADPDARQAGATPPCSPPRSTGTTRWRWRCSPTEPTRRSPRTTASTPSPSRAQRSRRASPK